MLAKGADGRLYRAGDGAFSPRPGPDDRAAILAISLCREMWSPGTWLRVRDVAASLGVSLTTAHSDLRWLADTGLVVRGRHHWFVAGSRGESGRDASATPAERLERAASDLPSAVHCAFRKVCALARVLSSGTEEELANVWRIWRAVVDETLPPYRELLVGERETLVAAVTSPVAPTQSRSPRNVKGTDPQIAAWLTDG